MTDLHDEIARMFSMLEGQTTRLATHGGFHIERTPETQRLYMEAYEQRLKADPDAAAKRRAYKTKWQARKRAQERGKAA